MIHALWLSAAWDFDPTWSFLQVNHFSKFLDLVQHIIEEKKRIWMFLQMVLRNRHRAEEKLFPINDVIPMAKQILSDFIWAIPVKFLLPLP